MGAHFIKIMSRLYVWKFWHLLPFHQGSQRWRSTCLPQKFCDTNGQDKTILFPVQIAELLKKCLTSIYWYLEKTSGRCSNRFLILAVMATLYTDFWLSGRSMINIWALCTSHFALAAPSPLNMPAWYLFWLDPRQLSLKYSNSATELQSGL